MLSKNNVAVLDKSITLIPCIRINKDGKIWANVHFYKTIGQKIGRQIAVSGEIRDI
jgi:hypothetical protein